MPGRNCTRYNFLLLVSFVHLFLVVLSDLGIALTISSEVRVVQDMIIPMTTYPRRISFSHLDNL